jgi:hypothetical protein
VSKFYESNVFSPWNTVVPVTAFWLLVMTAAGLSERAGLFNGSAWWHAPLMLLWLLAAIQYIHSVIKLSLAIKTFGRQLPSFTLEMSRIFRLMARAKLEISKITWHAILSGAALVAIFAFKLESAKPFAAFLIGLSIVIVLRNFLPPTALYLSSSAEARLDLFRQLVRRSAFTSVHALLEIDKYVEVNQPIGPLTSKAFVISFDLRTNNDDVWKKTAGRLMAISALIILDARDASSGVLYEAREIFRRGFLNKSIFLSKESGELPALERLRQQDEIIDTNVLHLTEQALLNSITKLTMSAKFQVARENSSPAN